MEAANQRRTKNPSRVQEKLIIRLLGGQGPGHTGGKLIRLGRLDKKVPTFCLRAYILKHLRGKSKIRNKSLAVTHSKAFPGPFHAVGS